MSYRIIVQLFIFAISMAIVFMYIQPKFLAIQSLQAEQERYDVVLERATQFNALLNTLLNTMNSLSQTDLQKVERYLPQVTDTVAVAKNIESIAWKNGVNPNKIIIAEQDEGDSEVTRRVQVAEYEEVTEGDTLMQSLDEQKYTVHITGPYASFKNFLLDIESNNYPLQVTALSVAAMDDDVRSDLDTDTEISDQYEYVVSLKTYSLANDN